MRDIMNQSIGLTPPEEHEICECAGCHQADEHKNPLHWFEACDACADDLAEDVSHTTYEFTFQVDDVKKAQDWARAKHYRYDTVKHLLHDAMDEGVIKPHTWKAA